MRLLNIRLHVTLLVLLTRPTCLSAAPCRTIFSFRYAYFIGHVSYRNTFDNIASAVACSDRCSMDPACRSVMFVPSTGLCRTYVVRIPDPPTSGSVLVRYGEIDKGTCEPTWMFGWCATDSDCSAFPNSICYEDECRCQHGYSYTSRTDTCVPLCTEYGSTFTVVPNFISLHNNLQSSSPTTFQECADLCIAQQGFTCRFFEFLPNDCMMSEETGVTKPDFFYLETDGYTCAQRNCA